MQIRFRQFAGDFTRFTPNSFDHVIGKQVKLFVEDLPLPALADVMDAKVSNDGREVLLTIQVADDAIFPSGLKIAERW